jgi:hypothetical protein
MPDPFHIAALARVPLAEAALRLLDHVLDPEGLARVFADHRGAKTKPCYAKKKDAKDV